MSNNKKRSFKIITNLVEVLSLEEEEFFELDQEYEKRFNGDFKLELEFLISINGENTENPRNDDKPLGASGKFLKSLHRLLAIKTHPDLTNNSGNDFKIIQAAYEEGDIVTMFKAANKHGIKYSIENKDKDELLNHIYLKRQSLNNKKQTVKWVWGSSTDHTKEERENILKFLKLDKDKFEKWKKNRYD